MAETMILLSGIDWKILVSVAIGSIIAIGLSLMLIVNLPELAEKVIGIKPYQIERIETWFTPEVQDSNDTYQIDLRSEERRVGKECRYRRGKSIRKKRESVE